MARPSSWSLCSPFNGYYPSLRHPEQMVRTKVVAGDTKCLRSPQGSRPSAPVTSSHYHRAGCLWYQALTLNSSLTPATLSGSATPREEWVVDPWL